MIQKKNAALYVALLLPILMIVVVVGLVSMSNRLVNPTHNFVYSSGDYYYGYYSIRDEHLVQNAVPMEYYPKPQPYVQPVLYVYDVKSDQSREVSFEEASQFRLDPSQKSPDGYEVTNAQYEGGIFGAFFGGPSYDYNARYIRGNGGSKKLNLKLISNGYGANFQFIGWVK